MVSEAQRDRAHSMIEGAVAEGAVVATGGRKLNRPGAFLELTILTGVTPDMAIANEEAFAPVLSLLVFSDDQQAVDIANGTPYGLVGGIFTGDIDRATSAAWRIRAGKHSGTTSRPRLLRSVCDARPLDYQKALKSLRRRITQAGFPAGASHRSARKGQSQGRDQDRQSSGWEQPLLPAFHQTQAGMPAQPEYHS